LSTIFVPVPPGSIPPSIKVRHGDVQRWLDLVAKRYRLAMALVPAAGLLVLGVVIFVKKRGIPEVADHPHFWLWGVAAVALAMLAGWWASGNAESVDSWEDLKVVIDPDVKDQDGKPIFAYMEDVTKKDPRLIHRWLARRLLTRGQNAWNARQTPYPA
jgi:hypothetical protein